MIWFIGGIITQIPLMDILTDVDPEGASQVGQAMMEDIQANPGKLALLGVSAIGCIIFSLATLVLFIIGITRKPAPSKTLMTIAAICAAIALAAFFYMNSFNHPDDVQIITRNIANSPGIYTIMLLGFPPMIFGLWVTHKAVHGRPFKALLTAHKKFRWGRVLQTMLIYWAVIGVVATACHLLGLNEISLVFNSEKFLIYALISLLLIPLQSATEELVLRGYLNQGLGKYIKNPWIVFVITSLGFASLHLANPEAAAGASEGKLLITMSGYFFFGFFACILTWIDGGLESAIGMHVANNLFAAIFMGYDNSVLPTPTVYKNTLNPDTDWIVTIIVLAVATLILWKFRPALDPDAPSREDIKDDMTESFS